VSTAPAPALRKGAVFVVAKCSFRSIFGMLLVLACAWIDRDVSAE